MKRRSFMGTAVASLALPAAQATSYDPVPVITRCRAPCDWQTTAPGDAGFAADLQTRFDAGLRSGLLRDLHAVLVSRHSALVLEYYGKGQDQAWGRPLGEVTFDEDTLHDIRSVTKSIVGILYGIALARRLVPALDAPLLPQFPEYPDLAADPQRARLTVRHALNMTMGLEWKEQGQQALYNSAENSEIAMENAPDRYRYALDRPVVAEPGTRWIYSGGSVALIGALIARGSGKTLPEFAREALFTPLGISAFEWAAGRDGVASAASGLRLRARDLLKIGRMLLDKGVYGGQQVVPAEWIAESFKPVIATGDGLRYGRLWYVGQNARTPALPEVRPWVAGIGLGGQRLWLLPDANLVAVTFSGQYQDPEQWVSPIRVWREIVVPNFLGPI